MAWAYVQDIEGETTEQYDKIAAEVGNDAPDGLIVHVAGEHGNGIRIIDVWESEDAFMKFRNGKLGAAIEKVMGPDAMAQGPPPFDALDVRNIVRG